MKTYDLIGAALDWAVSKCEGIEWEQGDFFAREYGPGFKPSTDWAHGGPIIERERIELSFLSFDEIDEALPIWHACKYVRGVLKEEQGHTPLIAAMRCFVASKLGEIVEVPDAIAQL